MRDREFVIARLNIDLDPHHADHSPGINLRLLDYGGEIGLGLDSAGGRRLCRLRFGGHGGYWPNRRG